MSFAECPPDLMGRFTPRHPRRPNDVTDLSSISSTDLADRIAILRDNIRQITEQATAQSGAADEDRNADRLAIQNEELDSLVAEQARRSGK